MTIALVAHDARKNELIEWVKYNTEFLSKHHLIGTGTTARLLNEISDKLRVEGYKSGPLGGDQQLGAMIANGEIDMLVFFCDNLSTPGHMSDVNALSRLASLYNIPYATNRTTADMIITSLLFDDPYYQRIIPGAIENYANRKLK